MSNPVFTGLKPARLYDRATGYGIVRFKKATREITIECWPRVPESVNGNGQYAGWPITIAQQDNYSREPYGYLPTVETNIKDPVVQVVNEKDGEVVYTLRIQGRKFNPPVFESGTYTMRVGPSSENMKTIKGIGPKKQPYGLARFKF